MNKNDLIVLALAGVAVFMLLKSSAARPAPKQANMLNDVISRVGWDWRIDGSQQDQMLDAQEAGF